LVVQHITPGFMPGFVAWLDGGFAAAGGARRRPRRPAARVHPSRPDGMHLTVANGHLRLVADDGAGFHCPSGSALLASLAREFADQAIGVVLTGMGNDGSKACSRCVSPAPDRGRGPQHRHRLRHARSGGGASRAVEESLPLTAIRAATAPTRRSSVPRPFRPQ